MVVTDSVIFIFITETQTESIPNCAIFRCLNESSHSGGKMRKKETLERLAGKDICSVFLVSQETRKEKESERPFGCCWKGQQRRMRGRQGRSGMRKAIQYYRLRSQLQKDSKQHRIHRLCESRSHQHGMHKTGLVYRNSDVKISRLFHSEQSILPLFEVFNSINSLEMCYLMNEKNDYS